MVSENSIQPCFQRNARRPRRTALLASATLLAVLALTGCGRRDRHRVAGLVRYADGQPVTSDRVVLDYGPQAAHGGWGYIRADGTFTLGSFAPDDGVRAGTVRVAIVNAMAVTPGRDPSIVTLTPLVHPRFENPATSGLSFEIPRQTKWEIVVARPK